MHVSVLIRIAQVKSKQFNSCRLGAMC